MPICASGHLNPAASRYCGVCGAEITPDPYVSAPPQPRRGWVWGVVAGAAGVLVIGIVAVVLLWPRSASISVVLTVYTGSGCSLPSGYDNVPGADVTIRAGGERVEGSLPLRGSAVGLGACAFRTTISGLPRDASTYALTIGTRGTVDATKRELEASDWEWAVSLGDD